MDNNQFLKAKAVNHLSYSPYSKYRVSACIKLKNGEYITGVNIENASYPLSICAERCALFKAVSSGYTKDDFESILIYTNRLDSMPYPCGACRQVMAELMNLDSKVIVVNDKEMPEEYKISDLLPHSFNGDNL